MIEINATFYETDKIHGTVFMDILIDYGHKSQTITY